VSSREPAALELTLTVSDELLTALAERLGVLAPTRVEESESSSPWLNTEAASAYLGVSRAQLYKLTAANAIPVHRKRRGQGLRFRREELDAWLEAEYESTGWTRKVELLSSIDKR
jgi:excisionase family DNA binding protein